ncbi:hypothetical protein FT663_02112 [Candidozyma haemuli var. vulneris]|uniref:Major facilitator superfamily (MFS) profile domain-containing protein n=1 Tax=Candidozyma haemuli TaxID=45357 RepID=A0A2V1AQ07_9ASCO|nr:hypothetical protein CXQ85_001941 [[Candida] haemuloni]KAF3985871.1 hypothetical protein FT662_04892 [[Candida] haemuloni var. vulneris]KAF3992953.1 hypothetical protein FT663_02112 [[Candida] haemuloni var. vulneris]PVH20160.1 hypothetical protein CXQ85_001941 [[Candida] haemuloni]
MGLFKFKRNSNTKDIIETNDVQSKRASKESSRDSLEKLKESKSEEVADSDLESQEDPTGPNPFKDPFLAEHYARMYEESKYECRAAFDPHFEWTPEEDKKLMRKVDYRVIFSACIMFVSLQINRGNLQEAVADNLLDDMNLDTNDYNVGNTVFLVSFLLAEVPSQIISKRLGPDIFIPIQICVWSIVSMCQGAMNDMTGFLICRALIGAFQGGFIADMVLWLTYFYKSGELPLRLSYFWAATAITKIATSLLAFVILRMRDIGGLTGWQWLFIIEGGISLLIGIWSFYLMVPSAVQTRNKLHPKGWFTEREEKIVVNRILRDDPSKGGMHNRQALSFKMIMDAFWDYNLWPIYAIGMLAFIPINTVSPYMVLAMRNLGFSTFDVNLLTIPSHILQIVGLFFVTWFSERVNERALVCLSLPIFSIPFLAAMRWWSGTMVDAWVTWFLVTMVLSAPYVHAICVSWVSRNSNSIKSRSVCSALYNMLVQAGRIAAFNIYREDDLPLYKRGNMQLTFIMVGLIPIILLTKVYYVWKNKQRDTVWNVMSTEEQQKYITETKDSGNKRLDFRFDH